VTAQRIFGFAADLTELLRIRRDAGLFEQTTAMRSSRARASNRKIASSSLRSRASSSVTCSIA
jgi:hypothetical protein